MPLGISTVREMYCDNEDCSAYDGIRVSADGDGWNTPKTYPADCPRCGGLLYFDERERWLAEPDDDDE